jgi:hypothetical protein
MTEKDRCKIFMNLITKLYKENDTESLALLKTFADKDHPSIKKCYELMTESSPIADLFGYKNCSEMFNPDKKIDDIQ